MNLKEALIFAYGVIFATSTPYIKPKKRFLFPTATWKLDQSLTFFLGGSGICARLNENGENLIVNTNLGSAADQWRADMTALGGFSGSTLVLNSLNGAFGGVEEVRALEPSRVFAHADATSEDSEFASIMKDVAITNVEKELELQVGDETVLLIPIEGCATESDLIVFFKKRSVMMFGALFLNRIHPVLKHGVALRAPKWIAALEELLAKYDPQICVPGEGEAGSAADVREFIRYLKSLTDPSVEFSFCRQNFDWMEIPRFTSLEENFDILRRNVKTHTSLR